jgi:hypothetical protein
MKPDPELAKLREGVVSAMEAFNRAVDAQDLDGIETCKLDFEAAWEKYSGQKIILPSPAESPGEHIRLESATLGEIMRNPDL